MGMTDSAKGHIRQLLRRAWHALRRETFESDLKDELEFHRLMKQQELEANGVGARDAEFATKRAMGNILLARDLSRDVWCPRWLQGLGQDVRCAVRALRSSPLVTVVLVASLALGVGANTAVFSLVNSLVLRTLPIPEPQRLVTALTGSSYATWSEIRRHAALFDGALAWSNDRFNVTVGDGDAERIEGLYVSGELFSTLGIRPIAGRLFDIADDAKEAGDAGPIAVVSYGFWQRRLGGLANVIGQHVEIEHVPFTIVGVTPPEFFGLEVGRTFDVAVPIRAEPLIRTNDRRIDKPTFGWLTVMLRLRSDQSVDSATATLRGIQPQIRAASMPPDWPPQFQQQFLNQPFTARSAEMGVSALRRQYTRPLLVVFVIVAVVLLIACANVANLLLARTTARRHELSLRVALGASQWRLARQWLVESLIVAAAAASAGYLVASWASRALVAQLSTSNRPAFLDLSVDWRVLAFTAAIAVATAVIFGTVPAIRAARTAPIEALKAHGRQGSGDPRATISGWLVTAQVALSLILVVAAGLFVRTFQHLATSPLGFDPDRVLVVDVNAARARVDAVGLTGLFYRLADAAAAVPGVERAAVSSLTPFSGNAIIDVVNLPGEPPTFQLFERGAPTTRSSLVHFVTPGWLAVYGTAIRVGRDVGTQDTTAAPKVALVNDAFVRKFFPGKNAIGATFSGLTQEPKTIIGIVGDAVYSSVRESPPATIYVPLAQWDVPSRGVTVSVRPLTGPPAALSRSVLAALNRVDADLTFISRPFSDQFSALLIQEQLLAVLSGFFGALALGLGALGLYGVTAYAVSRRRSEIGVRLALGATRGQVVLTMFSRASIIVCTGIVIGAGVSLLTARFIGTLLYGLEPRDVPTLVGAALILAWVGGVAALVPAWGASRIDPVVVLREQ
jgi:predicted permease